MPAKGIQDEKLGERCLVVGSGVSRTWADCAKTLLAGFALVVAVMAGLYIMIVTALQQAYAVLDVIETEGGMPDSETIRQAAAASDSPMITVVSVLIMVCWIVGIIDAFRIGKQKDLEEQTPGRMKHGAGDSS